MGVWRAISTIKRERIRKTTEEKKKRALYRTYVKRCSHLRHILNVWHFRRCLTLFFLISFISLFFQNSMYVYVYGNVFNAFFPRRGPCVFAMHTEYVLWVPRTGKCRLYRMHVQCTHIQKATHRHTQTQIVARSHYKTDAHAKTFTNYRRVVVVDMCICAWIFVFEQDEAILWMSMRKDHNKMIIFNLNLLNKITKWNSLQIHVYTHSTMYHS